MADESLLWMHAEHRFTVLEVCECSGLTEAEVLDLVQRGALAAADPSESPPRFSARCVASVRAAVRLREDLELDWEALALALSFLERIETLEEEVRRLRAELPAPRA